jgi:hypothetical protein
MEMLDLFKDPASTEIAWTWIRTLFPDAAGGTPFTRGLWMLAITLFDLHYYDAGFKNRIFG